MRWYGINFDHADWKPAIEHYYWDRMEAAYEVAEPLGTGTAGAYLQWFRMIEAEYVTRVQSTTVRLTDWLEFECIPDEVAGHEDRIALDVRGACDEVAERFGYEHGPATLVSIMALETDAPWTTAADGFCIDKHPYEKICLPNSIAFDSRQLREAVRHEYAHVMTLNLSAARVPRWLDEAVAMVAGGEHRRDYVRALVQGAAPWLSAGDLNEAYSIERRYGGHELNQVVLAYEQSGIVGAYLVSLKGERSLCELMRAYSNNSFLTEMAISTGLVKPTGEALGEVYGLGVDQVFAGAYDWLMSGKSGLPGA